MQNDSTKTLYRGAQVVWYGLYIILILLSARFILILLGADSEAAFTNFIYTVSDVFVWPFAPVFSDTVVDGTVFEWTTLLAMLMYWLLAMLIIKLFVMSRPVSRVEANERLLEEDS